MCYSSEYVSSPNSVLQRPRYCQTMIEIVHSAATMTKQ